MRPAVDIAERDLESLDAIWSGGLGEAWEAYRDGHADGRVALAAALVETGLELQGLGAHTAPAGELLIGDLCLARASRLLADAGDRELQVAFATAVEKVAAQAAAGEPVSPVRELLRAALAK
ncbi:MAG: hypothetical protein E6I08_09420 [Chloroflexi bacterium]|nr:MAG: hypothetical protein E6I08_09420 [Chloroflexota bacterium]